MTKINFASFLCFLFIYVVHNTQGKSVSTSEASILRTTITIVVVNNDASLRNLCVECRSGNGGNPHEACFGEANPIGTLDWIFQEGIGTIYRCTAKWGSWYFNAFPVFGEGVPRRSSSWLIDVTGKRRTSQDGSPVDDFFQPWSSTDPPTTTTQPTTTTTTEPTTTTTTTEPTTTTTTTEPTTTTTTTEPTTTTTTEPPTTTTTTEPTTTTTTEPTTTTTTEPPTTTTTTEPTTTTTTEPPTTTTTTEPPTTTTTSTTERTTTTTVRTTTVPWPDFDCPTAEGNFPDPNDCASFFSCIDWIVTGHQTCPDGLLYNPAIQNCDYHWNVDCDLVFVKRIN